MALSAQRKSTAGPIVPHTVKGRLNAARRPQRWLLAFLVALAVAGAAIEPARATELAAPNAAIALGRSIVTLAGPWKFRIGDDPRWADPGFDDSGWETVDLAAAPGAHDADVGLTGYVPGWMARGHAGYYGYAWYRLRVSVTGPPGDRLAIAGPLYVDSAYQLFLDGRLLGGVGDFSGSEPLVFSRRPQMFPLPHPDGERSVVIAIRTWMGRGTAGGSDAGGIHIAPALGEEGAVAALEEHRWLEIFEGYVVDAVEPLALLLLALMAWSVARVRLAQARVDSPAGARADSRPDSRTESVKYRWLILALVLTAAVRANQPFFFWTHLENLWTFDVVRSLVLTPLGMGAWMMAWHSWFGLRRPQWLPIFVFALTGVYLAAQLLTRPWSAPHLPHALVTGSLAVATWVRWVFALVLGLILVLGIRQRANQDAPDRWLAGIAILLVAAALFAQELSVLGVQGIWFPFGVGVSRTQYVLAALIPPLFVLLLRRLTHRCGLTAPSLTAGSSGGKSS